MDDGPWTSLGTLSSFLAVWVVMMAAMMFPSVAPTVALYSRMTRERSPVSALFFSAGYLVAWTGAGTLAFVLATAGDRIAGDALAWDRAGRWIAGATLVVAALYELTPLKDVCLGKCRQLVRLVARRPVGCAADGCKARRLVRGLLLGAHGLPLRSRGHEHHLDGLRCRADRRGENRALAPDRHVRDGSDPARPRRAPARRT
jgi:predicted metal-binding membrane protein